MMNHLNLISFICLILFLLFIKWLMRKSERTRNIFLKTQLIIVLLYNLGIIYVFPYKMPVEFSTISYFLVPMIVLFNIKELRIWATYTALLSGVMYYLSMIFFGNMLYSNFPVYSVATSLFNHGSLLTFAFITLGNYEFQKSERKIVWFGLMINAFWSLSIRPLVLHPGRIFIYAILDGYLAELLFPNLLVIFYPIYLICLIGLLYISPSLMLGINKLFLPKPIKMNKEYSLA